MANHWYRAEKTVHILTPYIPSVIQAGRLSKIVLKNEQLEQIEICDSQLGECKGSWLGSKFSLMVMYLNDRRGEGWANSEASDFKLEVYWSHALVKHRSKIRQIYLHFCILFLEIKDTPDKRSDIQGIWNALNWCHFFLKLHQEWLDCEQDFYAALEELSKESERKIVNA